MIYPDEAMLYAPVECHDCSEGFEDIRYEKSTDGIAKITINRPQVRNAFRPLTVKEMIQALADARYDDNIGEPDYVVMPFSGVFRFGRNSHNPASMISA